MRDFKKLLVWQKAHKLTLEVYRVTADFPKSELFGLTSQIRRAAVSIEANIAEGCGRWGDGDFGRFLQMAAGSGSELECHFLTGRDLEFMGGSDYESLQRRLDEVARMLTSLRQKVAESSRSSKARSQEPGARS